MEVQGGAALARRLAPPYLPAMGKLLPTIGKLAALALLALPVVGDVLELISCWPFAEAAPARATGAPIPMHDEPDGVPTEAAPSGAGTNRFHAPEKPGPGWTVRSSAAPARPTRS